MLLHNKDVWQQTANKSTPILMICHTNHALDQFLELIVRNLNVTRGIIRVGGRCQNEIVRQFSLSNARQHTREIRSTPQELFLKKKQLIENKNRAEAHLREQQDKLKNSQINILRLSELNRFSIIDYRHYDRLVRQHSSRETRDMMMFEWLGVSADDEQIRDNSYEQNRNEYRPYDGEYEEEQRRRDELDYENDEHVRSIANNETNKRKRSERDQKLIDSIVKQPSNLNDRIIQQVPTNVWQLSLSQRYNLYRYWLLKYQQQLQKVIQKATITYQQAVSRLDATRQDEDYHIIKNNNIVAMTTTCAAKYHGLLQKLRKNL